MTDETMPSERARLVQIMRDHIVCDATGLAPAVASVFLRGFDEAADAILAALSEQPVSAVGWRNIASAPKDGTPFLGWMDRVEQFYWQSAEGSRPVGWRHFMWVYPEGKGPTHWQPLPAAPAPSADREDTGHG
jgi:hypothetical protein